MRPKATLENPWITRRGSYRFDGYMAAVLRHSPLGEPYGRLVTPFRASKRPPSRLQYQTIRENGFEYVKRELLAICVTRSDDFLPLPL